MEKEDNIKIGKALGIFTVNPLVGKGLPMLLPKGATIKRILERFAVDEELKRGYKHVSTPIFGRLELYKTSGHWPYYKDDMYPPVIFDGVKHILRPMSCPHHFEMFKNSPKSYKELPYRMAELAQMFRKEKSGELRGLMRVRGFVLADAHIFCTRKQLLDELVGVLDLIKYCFSSLGLKNVWYRLGTRGTLKSKFIDNPEMWDIGEKALKDAMKKSGLKYTLARGEGAFYGPKVDIQTKNVYGKEDTLFTVQVDFALPGRFKLKYIDRDNKLQEPVVIHRSSIGAVERTIGFLLEEYQGNLPLWLSPVQVKLLNFTDEFISYARQVESKLNSAGIRVETDYRSESVQKKVSDAEKEKVNYILVVGGKEKSTGTVAVRPRGGKPKFGVKTADFIKQVKKEDESKVIK